MTKSGSVGVIEALWRAMSPLVTRHPSLVTAVLIHGSAIKSHGKPWRFNHLQFSNRR
jgi:hypothetical protein